jgi:hypothetical protein
VTLSGTATDVGSDDLTFSWEWGDGTTDTVTIHYNEGEQPDPYPSPQIKPMEATDTVGHTYGDNGVYTVTLTVEDDDGGVAEVVTTTVTVWNIAPTAFDDTATTNEDQAVVVDVLDNDSDPAGVNDPLQIILLTDGSKGSTSIDDKGTVDTTDDEIVYSPNLGETGADSFSYTIGDGDGGTDTGTVSVTILNLVDLSGRVYNDLDNDGEFDQGQDHVLPGVTVAVFHQGDEVAAAAPIPTPIATAVTNDFGEYFLDANLHAGSYKLVELVDELAELGLLDGKETFGNLGGTVDNSQDNNQITDILVGDPGTTADAVDYLFAEIEPAELYGRVWRDFNHDGDINFGEVDINGVQITLSGTDDRGSVSRTATTDGDLGYVFPDLRPGEYVIEQTQPEGFDDGRESLGEVDNPNEVIPVGAGVVDGNDKFSAVTLAPGSRGDYYNFGERPQPGDPMSTSSTATIGFWHNKNGQALIKQLSDAAAANGGQPTQLGDWLAATFPNMYGEGAKYDAAKGDDRDMSFAGKSGEYIAETFGYLHARNKKTAVENGGTPKVDAQVLAVALAAYATSENLAGTVAQNYGFTTSADGIACSTFNVLSVMSVEEAAMLGLSTADGNMDAAGNATIIDILLATNDKTSLGLLYDHDQNLDDGHDGGNGTIDSFERLLRTLANVLYTAMNEQSDI